MLMFYRLTPAEIAFLKEYAKTMKPVAKAVNILQGQANVQMGWLVPTITLLKVCVCKFCYLYFPLVLFFKKKEIAVLIYGT